MDVCCRSHLNLRDGTNDLPHHISDIDMQTYVKIKAFRILIIIKKPKKEDEEENHQRLKYTGNHERNRSFCCSYFPHHVIISMLPSSKSPLPNNTKSKNQRRKGK